MTMNMDHTEGGEFVSFKAGYTDDSETGRKKRFPSALGGNNFEHQMWGRRGGSAPGEAASH